ncbi:MAG TPA: FKBP-type peptidyl-prolyl cis-trans isomerase [Ignavibacteriaceae bacterium]|nr:FKBP-type peptidyl-prolyl cis-trans isomerase [Ignavibacteriaceae bacterium]
MKKILIAVLGLIIITSCGNKQDVVKTESGLTYVDNKVGEGREVKDGDLVNIHFIIWRLGDSTDIYGDWQNDTTKNEFKVGSSYEGDQQMKYVVGSDQFVKGSDEGFKGMKAGGKRTMVIPASNAYGDEGLGPIPPNSSIKIMLEVFEVKDPIVAKMWYVDSTLFKQTESGLKYAIIEEGSGHDVQQGKVTSVHYSGFLSDGTKFDSSVEREEPLTLIVGMGQVIPGWDEGLQLLKQGSKARFIIPPQLAYGERDLGVIPPNSTLIFDVEVVEVKDHQ